MRSFVRNSRQLARLAGAVVTLALVVSPQTARSVAATLPRALTTVPSIAYSTAVPMNLLDGVTSVALDDDGSLWVVGNTRTDSVPVTDDAFDKTFEGQEGFVIKLNPQGQLEYASYVGGSSFFDIPGDVTLDADGNVYIAGATLSDDFPVTPDAVQPDLAAPEFRTMDAFLLKLDPQGALLYSTYYGGSCHEHFSAGSEGEPAAAVAVADDGSVYLAGTTCSPDFPVVAAQQSAQTNPNGSDGYLVKFTADFQVVFATYLGGSNTDYVYRIDLDANGNPYLLGCSFRILGAGWSFPLTPGAFQTDSPSSPNFVTKFDPSGTVVYSTFLGPTSGDDPFQCGMIGDLAVDPAGNAHVVGITGSANFPTTAGAYQTTPKGFGDLFISKLDAAGANLLYSTYLGGTRAEQHNSRAQGLRIALDDDGNAFVTTGTFSSDLPVQTPLAPGTTGDFVAGVNPTGTGLVFSTYVPIGVGPLAVAAGAVYLAGYNPGQPGLLALKLTAGGAPCAGDCNLDGSVTVDEIVRGVNIALGTVVIGDCVSFDTDGSGTATVDELVRALTNALSGCG